MKILTAEQIRKLDEYTIENEPISSTDLMERAAGRFTDRFTVSYGPENRVAIFCGPGNNGGDGLCVARMLTRLDYEVVVYVVRTRDKGSDDFTINLRRLDDVCPVHEIREIEQLPHLSGFDIFIDALFGSGLSRPVEGIFATVVESINKAAAPTISIDIPSGLFSDEPAPDGAIIRAYQTFTFQVSKLSFMFPENGRYVGNWEVVDIGLHPKALKNAETDHLIITETELKSFIQPRSQFSHKGNYGKACIIAGGKGTMGAAVLSGRACLRTGIGLLTMHIPCCGYNIVQTAIPEAMAECDMSSDHLSSIPDLKPYTVVGAGPGIGRSSAAARAIHDLLNKISVPLVLDADALNILSENREMLELLPENTILTPHPIEFERLAGKSDNGFEQLKLQKEFSQKYKVIIVRKGAHTAVSLPNGKVFFNNTGNPGMATGGSGDVLTGIITATLGTYEPWQAAILGVYLHGLAADLALEFQSQESLLPTDLTEYIGRAYKLMWT